MRLFKRFFEGRTGRHPFTWAVPTAMQTPLHSVRRKFLLHGQEYLVTLKKDATYNRMEIKDASLHVSLYPTTHENFERYILQWYRRQARKTFQAAIDRWLPEFYARGYVLSSPRLKIYVMRRAWGRCYYTKGLITMNLHLVKAPLCCIEYIVLHELCHFVVNNHSKAFYDLMTSFLPEWSTVDAQLKTFAREHRIIR